MKNILAQQHRPVLEQFAWSNVLVALDYDGTLAPIVVDPDKALMRASTRQLLEQISRLYPCIVVSGRGQADVLRRLRGVGVREVIGNHGIEPWHANKDFANEVQRWLPVLETQLAPHPGVSIEDKVFSVAVHFRRSRSKKDARAAILRAARGLPGVRIIGGKQVVNVMPAGASHKGTALERARGRLGCDTAIYVGDDETDEDVFRLDQPGRLLTVRVGAKRTSSAHYCLANQREIDAFLRALLSARARATARGARA